MPENTETGRTADDDGNDEFEPTPWHFKLLLLAVVLYLGWRAVQGIIWVIEKIA